MKSKAFYNFMSAIVVLFAVSTTQVSAIELSRLDMGVQMTFPARYAVISDTGVQNRGGLSEDTIQQITKILSESDLSYVAVTRDFSEEIDISLLTGEYATFTYASDSELLDLGETLLSDLKKRAKNMDGYENVVISPPVIHRHSQTKFILIESTNGNMHTSQYITYYNNKGYGFAFINHSGDVNKKEVNEFISDIKFLQAPIDNSASIKPVQSSGSLTSKTLETGVIAATAAAVIGIPLLIFQRRKKT